MMKPYGGNFNVYSIRIIIISLSLVLFSTHLSIGQNIVKGKVISTTDSIPISNVSVILYEYNTNNIVSYTFTDKKGQFTLEQEVLDKPAYSIKFHHLSYNDESQNIFFEQKSEISLDVSISMTNKSESLDEVVIQSKPPILIKKDTIIYDIKHWIRENNQTLEDVIGNIEGLKVLASGDIEAKGQRVRKVLINGEEVFDVGASIITKSLDPKLVESIEVRFDEKNATLKESLLDTEKYVVLDIKLKDGFPSSIFGKIRATIGHLKNIEVGGYGNFFLLKEKSKIHLFTEYDRFGHQTISLSDIRNIGAESYQKIFELPTDFKSITEKETYNEDLFGFNDFFRNQKGIIGLTTKYKINENLNVFFGSYNSLDVIGKSKSFEQTIVDSDANVFEEVQNVNEQSSKNKFEIKYDSESIKARVDVNLVYKSFEDIRSNDNIQQDLNYELTTDESSLNFYTNLFFEKKINDHFGIELKTSFFTTRNRPLTLFSHNDTDYISDLIDDEGNLVNEFNQKVRRTSHQFSSSLTSQYRYDFGILEVGGLLNTTRLDNRSEAFNIENNIAIPNFSTNTPNLSVSYIEPFINNVLDFGSFFSITNRLGVAFVDSPTTATIQETTNEFNYKIDLKYKPTNDSRISLKYDNKLSQFPIDKLVTNYSLIDFQTIQTPSFSIEPKRESVLELVFYKTFTKKKIELVLAGVQGKSQNMNLFFTRFNSPFIFSQRDQLEGSYRIIATTLTKRFNNGLTLVLEPEFLSDETENIINDTRFFSTTKRYFLGLKASNKKKNNFLNYLLFPKYSSFNFSNPFLESTNRLDMLSITTNTNLKISKKNLYVDFSFRNVSFFGSQTGNFNNLNISFNGKLKNIHWDLSVSNILNDKEFTRQSIDPLFSTLETNTVFGRNIKFFIEYKF